MCHDALRGHPHKDSKLNENSHSSNIEEWHNENQRTLRCLVLDIIEFVNGRNPLCPSTGIYTKVGVALPTFAYENLHILEGEWGR